MAKTRQTAARSSGADPYAPSRKRRPAQAAKKKSKKKGEGKKQKVPPVASALSKFITHPGGSDSEESSLPSQDQTRNNTTRMKSLPPVDTTTNPPPEPLPPKSILEEVFIPTSLLSEVQDALEQLKREAAAEQQRKSQEKNPPPEPPLTPSHSPPIEPPPATPTQHSTAEVRKKDDVNDEEEGGEGETSTVGTAGHQPNTMSFANVVSPPRRPKATVDAVSTRLVNAFTNTLEGLREFARTVLPDINTLPTDAMNFLFAIFGDGDEGRSEPVEHADEDLVHFVPLCTSMRIAALAKQKLKDGRYQFRLRYFSGLRGRDSDRQRLESKHPSMKVVKLIKQFYTSIFLNPENEPIETCTRNARSLYITVRSVPPEQKTKSGKTRSKAGKKTTATTTTAIPEEETIIACLNFALMDGHGFFVNWLATSNETINDKKFGEELVFLCGGEGTTWQRRHIGLFLLKAANLAVLSHLQLTERLTPNYNIILQARNDGVENADKFYTGIGFVEGDSIQQISALDTQVFNGFERVLDMGKKSNTDYIHFIWNHDDIVVFTNTTGILGKKERSFSKLYRKSFQQVADPRKKLEKNHVVFPFAAIRSHLLLLASNIDLMFLPFRKGVDMNDFIQPSMAVTSAQNVALSIKDIDLYKKGSWLNGRCIDFISRW